MVQDLVEFHLTKLWLCSSAFGRKWEEAEHHATLRPIPPKKINNSSCPSPLLLHLVHEGHKIPPPDLLKPDSCRNCGPNEGLVASESIQKHLHWIWHWAFFCCSSVFFGVLPQPPAPSCLILAPVSSLFLLVSPQARHSLRLCFCLVSAVKHNDLQHFYPIFHIFI